MKLKNLFHIVLLAGVVMCVAPACTKEGPAGPPGTDGTDGVDGTDGKDGVDGGSDCKLCHNPTTVDLITVQYQFSKHGHGEAAFEESGNTTCAPCHAQEAYKYVVKNNVPSTFVLNTTTNKYVNQYVTVATAAYGEIGCSTCHSAIHSTYQTSDMAFTTVAPVSMTMWGGAADKTIDLKADGGMSNMCVKCHQPRPQTNLQTGNVQDYKAVAANPTALAYNSDNDKDPANIIRPSYRMHIHYGSVGAIYAGMGGVEFTGAETYANSAHTAVASCRDCHMGAMNERAGGHTFFMRNSVPHTGLNANTKWNFNGCNATGCHLSPVDSKNSALWVNPRAEIQTLLNDLAAKLVVNGVEIMNRNNDLETNLWAGITKNNYDGYLNVYDPSLNPGVGTDNVTGTFQNTGNTSSYTPEQKAYNSSLPKLSLTNAQYGAILNFQMCLRDYSLGIHNFKYTKALLKNSIAVLP